VQFLIGGSGVSPASKRSADCRMRCWHFIPPPPVLLRQSVFSPRQCRHTSSTLRDNRLHRRRWDNRPISVFVAKTGVFVCEYTVTLKRIYRHPNSYRHPPQIKVNRRFLNLGCRYCQFFMHLQFYRHCRHPVIRSKLNASIYIPMRNRKNEDFNNREANVCVHAQTKSGCVTFT